MFIYPQMRSKLKRGPQVILPKDAGIIIAFTQIDKNCVCLDAGTGSGWLTVSLARICKHVYSYDIRDDFLELGKKNAAILGLENITFEKQDIFKKINEKDLDIVTLDMPNAEKALRNVKKSLKQYGQVVSYFPNIEQVKAYVEKLQKLKFEDIYTVEVTVRDILVRKEGTRPTNTGLWHTGYMTFAKNVKLP